MHLSSVLLLTAEPALSRFTSDDIPDQARMEMLVSEILAGKRRHKVIKPQFFDKQGAYLDVCVWEGVRCSPGERVISIEWAYMGWIADAQKFGFAHLPRELKVLSLETDVIRGTIDWQALPANLQDCLLSENKFRGTIDVQSFPTSIRRMHLGSNKFSGTIALGDLPAGLTELLLESNELEGGVSLENLPPGLNRLDLSYNRFSGDVTLEHLPLGLVTLFLQQNKLTGTVTFANIPQSLRYLNVARNCFAAVRDPPDFASV